MPEKMCLCLKCVRTFETGYKVEEVPPLPGIPYTPTSRPCENCGKKGYHAWYKIKKVIANE